MVNFDKITMDNAKEFFFENKCMYSFMEWHLYPQFKALNIPKTKINEWINEYYTDKYQYFVSLQYKASFFYNMQYNFSEILNYELIKKYYLTFFENIENELPKSEFSILYLMLNRINYANSNKYDFEGVLKITYLNNDKLLMKKAYDTLQFILHNRLKNSKINEKDINKYKEWVEQFSALYSVSLE